MLAMCALLNAPIVTKHALCIAVLHSRAKTLPYLCPGPRTPVLSWAHANGSCSVRSIASIPINPAPKGTSCSCIPFMISGLIFWTLRRQPMCPMAALRCCRRAGACRDKCRHEQHPNLTINIGRRRPKMCGAHKPIVQWEWRSTPSALCHLHSVHDRTNVFDHITHVPPDKCVCALAYAPSDAPSCMELDTAWPP